MNMEYFEKAHSLKSNDILKKDSKTDEKVKKQLKQMLSGYKKSDNDLIRNSENVSDDLDSNSDNETTKATLDTSDLDSLSSLMDDDVEESRSEASLDSKINNECLTSDDLILSPSNKTETSSETVEENTSSLISGDVSILCSSADSIPDSDSSSLFDGDGVLASKIHEKLNNVSIVENKLKRKFDDNEESTENEPSLMDLNNSQLTTESEYLVNSSTSEKEEINLLEDIIFKDTSTKEQNILSKNVKPLNILTSPSFVSIKAKNVKTQKFDEIMGHYKYATVKNITSDQPNVTFSTFNTSHNWTVEDINTEVAGIIPEVGEGININNSNIDLIDLDISKHVENESMILNNDTIQSETITEIENSKETAESPIENYQVFSGRNCYIIVLRYPSSLYIHGKVIVRKLGGSAQLYGYNLQDSPCEVYAPLYNYAYCLKTVENNNDYYGLFNKLTTSGLSVAEAEEIVTKLGCNDVVVSLEKLNNVKMDFIESNFNTINLFSRSSENVELNLKRVSESLCCSLYSTEPYKHIEESSKWLKAVTFRPSSRGIICGGKGGGKTTFLRYYVNQMLSKGPVLVIDLDPGQCEFTVAGNISATVVNEPLLGPNYTHLKQPDIMFNIGMINTMDNPRRYISAVDNLVALCFENDRMRCMPWIVNTMGMCNEMGLKFISLIILRLQPTLVLQIQQHAVKKNFTLNLTPKNVELLYCEYKHDRLFANIPQYSPLSYSYIACEAQTYRRGAGKKGIDNFSMAPRDERYLNFLAYFGELLHIHRCEGLLGITPYSVRLQDLYIASNIKLHKELIAQVLNGKVVALCEHSRLCNESEKVFTLCNVSQLCHGNGLVRGIDFEKDVMYVITPIPTNILTLVNTILYADWVPELIGQEKNLPDGTVIPYRTVSHYLQRELMLAPRRRFNPLSLLKMSRN